MATEQSTILPPAAPPVATGFKLPHMSIIGIIRLVILAISIIWSVFNLALLWSNGIDIQAVIWALWWPAIFLVQLLIVTLPWRAVPIKEVGRMFLMGMSVVFFGAYLAELALTAVLTAYPDFNPFYRIITIDFILGTRVDVLSDLASPLCEEVFKILPVILFLLLAGRGYWKRVLGPLDVAILGGASGAGYLFMENIARSTHSWQSLGPDRWIDTASIHIGPIFLWPDAYHGSVSVWMGHPEVTMFVALCLGFGLFIRKKTKLWSLIPVLGIMWAIWLHFMINYADYDSQIFWTKTVIWLNLNGGLLQYVLLLGLLIAIGIATITKFQYVKQDKNATVAAVFKETQDYMKAHQGQTFLIIKKLWSLRHFWAYRHAVAYGLFYMKQQTSKEKSKWLSWLYALRQQAIGKPAQ